MAEAATPLFHSLDAFLVWEEQQAERCELLPGGVITMMAGGTGDHDMISVNIVAALRPKMRGTGCIVQGSNLKVTSASQLTSTYPDAFVRRGPAVGQATRSDDPVVVFEVLSEATASSDMSDLTRKRQVYKGMPTVQAIVYVTPSQYRLDVVRRGPDGRFEDEVLEGPDAVLDLAEIAAMLTLAEIFEDTSVATATGEAP